MDERLQRWSTCPVRRHAEARPDALAIASPEAQWTYAALSRRVDVIAGGLRADGVGVGTRVALWMPRSPRLVAWLWALWRVGAVAVPVNVRLPSVRVPEALRRAGSPVLVTSDASVARVVETSDPHGAVGPIRVLDPHTGAEERDVVTSGSEDDAHELDRDATLVFTSGSTGTPKAALHTWRNHVASAVGSNANLPLEPGDRWLLSLPLYHVGGLAILVRCALAGAAVEIPPNDATLADAVRRGRVTHLSVVATQLRRLLEAAPSPPPSMRAVLCGGSAIPAALLDDAVETGWPVHTTYGCTEMASQITTTPPGATRDDLHTSGRLLPYRALRIDAPAGEPGPIRVRGDTLFRGYADGTHVDDPRDADGWFATGDVGWLDADARLHVTGRVDRMFVSGGENVHPEEIEAALDAFDDVEQAVVVAVPDDEYGRRPVAFVRMRDADAPPDDLRRRLRAVLPGYKVPDAVHSLPDDATGGGLKVDRAALERRARKLR